jgi:endonuclease/exonuclease/phosphatase (EEP) superfamily protein YafD
LSTPLRPPSHGTGSSRSDRESWDTFTPTRPFQAFWVSLGVLTALPGLAATFLRVHPPSDDVFALVAAFISYGVLAYLFSTLCFLIALLRARRRAALAVLTALSAGLLGCHLIWLAPLFVADHRPATAAGFTVMSLNTRNGAADPREVSEQAGQADLVVLLEATPTLLDDLRPYGWDRRFPYSAGVLKGTVGDTILYSRFPLSEQALLPHSEFQQWIATAQVPAFGPVRVVAAHPCNPFCGSNQFAREHQQLRTAVDANLGAPLLVAGDLNAVDDHAPMRALRRDGLTSVTDIVGAGWLPTYPANRSIPPLLPIDHVLVNRFLTATSVQRFDIRGTDHLGLLARINGAA